MLKSLNGKWLQNTLNVVIFGSTYINKPRYKIKAQIVQWIVAVWSQFMHKAYFSIFGCYFSLPHRQQSIWVKQQEVVSPNTRLCSTLQIWMVQNYTASTFFFLNHKLCRHFQKDIQSQFNDTSLHSHALITHNPLPHPTYGLKTQGSNLSCALS